MGISQRNKGKVGERELSHFLTDNGFPSSRGQQFKGTKDSPDIQCDSLASYYIECKRVERLNIYEAYAQAQKDAGGKTPLVFHRRNRSNWKVTLDAEHFLRILIGDNTKSDKPGSLQA